jgi:hypothetical protein
VWDISTIPFLIVGEKTWIFRIRCAIQGFKTMIANHSLTLTFHGKSSWDGNETTVEEEQRRAKYIDKSMKKWV